MTIKEHKRKLNGLKIVYIGDGANNMSHSYLLGCAIMGMDIKIVSPKNYWPDDFYVNEARKMCANIEVTDRIEGCTKDVDVVATDTWVSMGDEKQKLQRLKDFKGYTVDNKLMSLAKPDAIFLHCLPAYYGYEVTKDVAHGPQSVIFDEAENRMWAQIAIMVNLCK
jgi:ornithine carbamoyltransferase